MEELEDILYKITVDDFVDDSPLFEPWYEAIDIEIGNSPDANMYYKEPKRPVYF